MQEHIQKKIVKMVRGETEQKTKKIADIKNRRELCKEKYKEMHETQ